jgi:hypothetical protein
VAFDPGGVTGWAVLSVHPDALRNPRFNVMDNVTHYAFGQFVGSEFAQVDAMIALLDDWPGAAAVTEQFILLQNNTSDSLLSPVRINAALRYGLHVATGGNPIKKRRNVLNQLPSLAKTTMTDERLTYGGYLEATRGQPHARDAIRHAFTFMKRVKTQYPLRKDVFPALA